MNSLRNPALEPENPAAPADTGSEALEFPCSIAQERFWLLDRLEPGNSSLNVAVRWRLVGTVDSALLEKAWLHIINRHEVLRTVFLEKDGAATQRVLPRSSFKLTEIDLTALPEDARNAEGDRIGVIEARAPFDLIGGPLIRATLLRHAPDDAVLLVTTHQIVSDGWSIGIMAREMGLIYQALRRDQPIPLEELSTQYADYAQWHLEWTRARGTVAEETYWSKQLAALKPFKVPADKPRPPIPTTNGAITSIVLPRELTNRAQAVSAEHGATLFAAAFGALTTMLHRYTGETDIVIGTQVADRDQVELESMIGQFVNSLILRSDLSGNPTFGELVERLRDTSAAALEHKHIPIERLLSMVKSERSNAQTALISVNFIYQRTFIENQDYGDFKLVDMPSLPAGAIYDLNFFMVERPDGWRFSCQFNTDQFERETVDRLLGYVRTVMDSATANPALRLSEIALISPEERQVLLAESATAEPPTKPEFVDLNQRFASQLAGTPDAPALSTGDRKLSYRQLDAEVVNLASHLHNRGFGRGFGRGQRIGLCLTRSADVVIAMLAVARLGVSWVALDPTEPASRLGAMVDAAKLAAVIVRGSQLASGAGPALAGRTASIDLETEAAAVSRATATIPAFATGPEDEACLVFHASASGRPKAFRINQALLLERLLALAQNPGLTAGETVLAVTAFAVEQSLVELLLPLLVGARIVIASDRDLAADSRLFLAQLPRNERLLLHASPPVWQRLLGRDPEPLSQLRVWSYGERPEPRQAQSLLDSGIELSLLYSVPGVAICAGVQRFHRAEDLSRIGGSAAGVKLRVLGPDQALLPAGAVGELHVGGRALTMTPAMTPASTGFDDQQADGCHVADPFDTTPGALLLKTGDLARMRRDGCVELLGRRDRALRLEGCWVEPAEIEAALCRHPNIADAAVTAVGSGLAGWVKLSGTLSSTDEAISEVLRTALAARLPARLIPASLKRIADIPKTADGSVDFRRLLRPAPVARPAAGTSSAGNHERRLIALWSTMLDRHDIEPDSNFFELGGHSLLAARMLGRIEAEFGRRLSLAALFRAPTVRELAQALEAGDTREFDFRQVVKLQTHGSRPPMIAINNTGSYYLLAKRLGPDQPVTSLQLFDPSLTSAVMPKRLEEIAAGYVELIRRVQPQGPYSLLGWCVAGALAFEVARQLDAANLQVANLYLMDSWVPNYLKRLPKLQGFIAEYSLRLQFVCEDWRKLREQGQGWRAFLVNREMVKRLRYLFSGRAAQAGQEQARLGTDAAQAPKDYDDWLLAHLQEVTSRYEPKPYNGRITLFRSHREPTGWWFDPNAGWAPYARDGVDLHMVDGDHFTMFQEPGVSQMAERITAGLKPRSD